MKKLFVLVFAIALCLGVLCVGASADIQPTKPTDGDGTAAAPYKIGTAAELYWFAEQVNGGEYGANAVLTKDITINKGVLNAVASNNTTGLQPWTPIGTDYTKAYTGTFDGDDHTISGLYYSDTNGFCGLFGYVGNGGQVKNVKVDDSYINDTVYVGGVCGYNYGGTITNCSFDGSVTSTFRMSYVGGVCGISSGSIINCYNTGSVTGISVVGGVCGRNAGTITNCYNSGTITGTSENVGGVCGGNEGGAITNCYNSGSVTGTGESVGGVCGRNDGTITNCYNTGDVTGTGNGTGTLYVGGVSGYNYFGTIENCYNIGKVSGNSAGGVCGYNDRGTITNCYSTGAVTGTSDVGGVCGHNYFGTIANCYNTGSVSGTDSGTYTGGVCGENNGTITNCYWLSDADSGDTSAKTADQFASGEVAWLLNSDQEDGPWRQDLSGDKDNDPVLNSTHQKVVKLTVDSAVSYLNSGDEVEEPAEGKVYVDGDGKIVQTPYTVEADTTLTSKHPVTAAIDITSTLSKVYEGTKAAPEGLSIALEGVVSGDDVTATATCSFEDANVGNGKAITASNITLTGDDAGEYVLRNTTAETYAGEITPRTVTIIADDKTAKRGEDMPVLTYTVNGFIGGDTMTSEPELRCDADMTVAGTYEITVSGGSSSSNYTLAYQKGTLTVNNRWLVTVKYENGDADVSSYVEPGSSFKLPDAPSKSGYYFVGWSDGNKTYEAGDGVTITADTTFTAVWREINIPDPNSITVTQPANGTIRVNPSNGSAGTLITVTATPDEGYELAYITVDGEKITGNTFRMPDKSVTVSAVFVPATFPFVDVKTGDWFYDYVAYVYANGLMDGTSATTFEPNANMTRAMLWTILARIDGEEISGADWAETARAWAMESGVSDGTDAGGSLTREQLAAMLYRFAGEPETAANLDGFTDAAGVSDWAARAMAWCVEQGIITGVTDTLLDPQGAATRAQCAAMLMRFVESV